MVAWLYQRDCAPNVLPVEEGASISLALVIMGGLLPPSSQIDHYPSYPKTIVHLFSGDHGAIVVALGVIIVVSFMFEYPFCLYQSCLYQFCLYQSCLYQFCLYQFCLSLEVSTASGNQRPPPSQQFSQQNLSNSSLHLPSNIYLENITSHHLRAGPFTLRRAGEYTPAQPKKTGLHQLPLFNRITVEHDCIRPV